MPNERLKCNACGRFVARDDPTLAWDCEYGETGSLLGCWVEGCGAKYPDPCVEHGVRPNRKRTA